MNRTALLAVLVSVSYAASSQAAASISKSSSPTVGLPGFNTWTLTGTVAPSDKIIGFDFTGGNGSFGFSGPMNQINPLGNPTVFDDFLCFECDLSRDSHFKVISNKGLAINASESANSLKAAFAYLPAYVITDASNIWTFVQVVIASSNRVDYSGELIVRGPGGDRLEPLSGFLGIPEPSSLLLLAVGCACLLFRRRK